MGGTCDGGTCDGGPVMGGPVMGWTCDGGTCEGGGGGVRCDEKLNDVPYNTGLSFKKKSLVDRTTLLLTPQAGETRRSLDEINPLCSNPNCRGNYLPVPIPAGLHADKMNDDHHAPCLREDQALCVPLVSVLALQLRHRAPIVEICHNRPLKRKKVCH